MSGGSGEAASFEVPLLAQRGDSDPLQPPEWKRHCMYTEKVREGSSDLFAELMKEYVDHPAFSGQPCPTPNKPRKGSMQCEC